MSARKKIVQNITGNNIITYICKKINGMPTLLRLFGLRFFFWSREYKPIHVHVESSDGIAKFEIETGVKLIEKIRLQTKDLRMAESILKEN